MQRLKIHVRLSLVYRLYSRHKSAARSYHPHSIEPYTNPSDSQVPITALASVLKTRERQKHKQNKNAYSKDSLRRDPPTIMMRRNLVTSQSKQKSPANNSRNSKGRRSLYQAMFVQRFLGPGIKEIIKESRLPLITDLIASATQACDLLTSSIVSESRVPKYYSQGHIHIFPISLVWWRRGNWECQPTPRFLPRDPPHYLIRAGLLCSRYATTLTEPRLGIHCCPIFPR